MKLWQKIYLFSTLLLVLTLNIAGFLLIEQFHNSLIQREVTKCLIEHSTTTSELNYAASLMSKLSSNLSFDIERSINSLMSPYTAVKGEHAFYQILDPQLNIIYTDTHFPNSPLHNELENLTDEVTNYIIRPINNQYYLYICQQTTLYDIPIILYYAKDISSLYAEKNHYYTFFIKFDILLCFLFAFFMFFISRLITKPIHSLITSTQKIAEGQYCERVEISTKDEFKTLADTFNVMAQTIEEKINDLEYSNEAKETFINDFTHELKTPLTSIIGYSNFMRTSKYNEDNFTLACNYIYKESKRLEQMAFKMMDLIYTKQEHFDFAPHDLHTLIENVKASLDSKLAQKNITLIVEDEHIMLMVDEILMHLLLSNLIENAIKASDFNSNILITTQAFESTVNLSITDYGIGIAPEHLAKLCEPFYVVDKARSRKNNGVGIGLSICQKIVTLHHGSLHIESQLGEGTTISIQFPIQ